MTLIIILGVIVVALVLWFFGAYNGLIRLRNTCLLYTSRCV